LIGISKEKLNMRDRNAIDILNELIHNTLLSPSEIGQSTGLSQATVCRILGQLQDGNLVKNMGKVATSKGRKPNLFSFNFNYGLLLHYYVTNRKVTGYLLNLAGDIINHCEISYEQSVALEDLIKIIDERII
jgi:transcription initiation factor IIE alpha subunit